MRTKKRLLLGAGVLGTVAATATLVAGVTFGLFSATSTPQSNSFTAQSVTLGTPGGTSCGVTNVVPGDSGNCTLTYTYTGSANAVLGLDLSITAHTGGTSPNAYAPGSDAGVVVPAANALFDGTADGLQLTMTDSNNISDPFITGGVNWLSESSVSNPLTLDSGSTGAVDDLFIGAYASGTITLHWSLPDKGTASNAYQLASSTFRLQVHAVQSDNNAATGCTVGQQCSSILWS